MDFTFLLVVVFMLLAIQQQQTLIAIGLFFLLLFSAKNKVLIVAAIFAGLLALAAFLMQDLPAWLVILGLFAVLLLIIRASPADSGPEAYAPGFYPPGY